MHRVLNKTGKARSNNNQQQSFKPAIPFGDHLKQIPNPPPEWIRQQQIKERQEDIRQQQSDASLLHQAQEDVRKRKEQIRGLVEDGSYCYCQKCNRLIRNLWDSCPYCGTKLTQKQRMHLMLPINSANSVRHYVGSV
jgi:hypothetical protein